MEVSVLIGGTITVTVSESKVPIYHTSFVNDTNAIDSLYSVVGSLEMRVLAFIFPAENNVLEEMSYKISKGYISLRDKEKLDALINSISVRDVYYLDLFDLINKKMDRGILLYVGKISKPIAYINSGKGLYKETYVGSVKDYLVDKCKELGSLPIYALTILFSDKDDRNDIPKAYMNLHTFSLEFIENKLKELETKEIVKANVQEIVEVDTLGPIKEKKEGFFSKFKRSRIDLKSEKEGNKIVRDRRIKERRERVSKIVPPLLKETEDGESSSESFELIPKKEYEDRTLRKKKIYEEILIEEEEIVEEAIKETKGLNYTGVIASLGISFLIFVVTFMFFWNRDHEQLTAEQSRYIDVLKFNTKAEIHLWDLDLLKLKEVSDKIYTVGIKDGYVYASIRESASYDPSLFIPKLGEFSHRVIRFEEIMETKEVKIIQYFFTKVRV